MKVRKLQKKIQALNQRVDLGVAVRLPTGQQNRAALQIEGKPRELFCLRPDSLVGSDPALIEGPRKLHREPDEERTEALPAQPRVIGADGIHEPAAA